MQITTAPGYLPPSEVTLRMAATEAEIKTKANSFILDACNLSANGQFLSMDEVSLKIEEELIRNPIKQAREGSRTHFQHKFTNNRKFDKYEAARTAVTNEYKNMCQATRKGLEALSTTSVPGDSPMSRAINFIKLLESAQQNNGGQSSGDGENESKDLQNLFHSNNINNAKNALNEAKALNKKESDMLKDIQKMMNDKKQDASPDKPAEEEEKKPGNMPGSQESKDKSVLQNAVVLTDYQMRDVIRISRKLNAMSKLKVSKITKFVPDNEETDVQNKQMQVYSDINKIKSNQFSESVASPSLFKYKAVTNQYVRRERGKYVEKKQLLYIIVDCSGSMQDEGRRIRYAAGILLNRLMSVFNGDATVFWRFFDTNLHECFKVEDKKSAAESINIVLNRENYSGGGTCFNTAISGAVQHIQTLEETMNLAKPEIFMVTDGECSCNLKVDELKGVKLHTALVANVQASQLRSLTDKSGGVVLDFSTI